MTSGDGVSLSVLTPTFRSGEFLATNLASVRGSGVQHVVMDGGSADGSVALLEAAPGVDWRSEPDDGQSDALNKALALATGDWIGWLNADEFYLPGVLPWVRRRLASDDCDVLFGDFAEVDVDGRLLRLVTNHRYEGSLLRRVGCYLPSCATFLRRDMVERAGGWRVDRRTIMDWDLYLRLDEAGARFRYEPFVAAGFTRHAGQVTTVQSERAAAEKKELLSDFRVVNPPWRHYLARSRRIALKTLNGGYAREVAAKRMRGDSLATFATDAPVPSAVTRLNPGIPVEEAVA